MRLSVIAITIMAITFALQPKQKELKEILEYNNQYEIVGYGGARGGAKSHAIRDLAIYFGLKYHTQSLIFRRYSDDLLKNHVYPMLSLYPELRPYFNKTEKVLYHPDTSLPIIKFDYADREEEIDKVGQGTEYQLVFVDEATQSTQKMIEYLTTCNRDSKNKFPSIAKTVLTMNPGGVGHAYVKRIMVDRIYYDNEEPSTYYFIQASVWDNVFWSLSELIKQKFTIDDYYYKWNDKQRKDFTIKFSTYAKRLSRLPQDLRDAYLFGDWNTFGGLFFKHFSKKQIIPPFRIPEGWEIGASIDPGFASPLSFGIQARDFKGNIYRIYTYYRIDTIPNHAKNINTLLTDRDSPLYPYLEGRLPSSIVSGHDAFSKLDKNAIEANDLTVEKYFRDYGLVLEKAILDRINGWWKWKSLIPERYFVFEGFNESLIRQITNAESDDKIVEDILGRGNNVNVEDHSLDEQRYGIQRLFVPTLMPEKPLPDWYYEEFGTQEEGVAPSVMSI